MALTNADKGKLAEIIITHVADLFEDWGYGNHEAAELLESLTADGTDRDTAVVEIRDAAARWMAKLPGSHWDFRLGPVPEPK